MSNKDFTLNQEVRLFFFSGFYGSIHEDALDREVEYLLEETEKEYDDYKFEYDWKEYAKAYVSAISSEIGINLKFRELTSPREYNFATDQIYCEIKPEDVEKLRKTIDSPTFMELIRERFTSRDGFMSNYSNRIEAWVEEELTDWDYIKLGTLLDAYLIDNDFDLDDLDCAGYDYCSGNGQYVSWEETEESIERTKQENLFNLASEEELKKLETWKKSVESWNE